MVMEMNTCSVIEKQDNILVIRNGYVTFRDNPWLPKDPLKEVKPDHYQYVRFELIEVYKKSVVVWEYPRHINYLSFLEQFGGVKHISGGDPAVKISLVNNPKVKVIWDPNIAR
jgi:hypothetical protein